MKSRLNLQFAEVSDWPPLAWLARCERKNAVVTVFHGRQTEVTEEWFCEAVWPGDYASGDFDQTDIVAGSGGRLRDGHITFVSAGSTVDRLNSLEAEDFVWVSNSLSCLLATLGAQVDPTYPRYYSDLKSIIWGLDKYRRFLNTTLGPVRLTYFDNLRWDGDALTIEAKPAANRDLNSFSHYRAFLESSISGLARNMTDSARAFPYKFLGTLSSGYDSATITTLARAAGCAEVICVDRARGDDEDSGEPLSAVLNVKPLTIKRDDWRSASMPEVPFIAADAKGEDVFFKGAESFLARRVLLTGFHGDKVWAKHPEDLSANIVRGDQSGLDLSEYRLQVGFIHCPVTFWGVRQIRDINRISNSEEMKPWDVPGDYSRPICRRIVEEAGVPREMFGTRKRAASVLFNTSDQFLTTQSLEDYTGWLSAHRKEWIRRGRLPPIHNQTIDRWKQLGREQLMATCSEKPLLWRISSRMEETSTALRRYIFPWALDRNQKLYPRPFKKERFNPRSHTKLH
ncbi:MAG TPA: hypothetical protein VF766_07440 [Pyrinomonadaceae bacterium]